MNSSIGHRRIALGSRWALLLVALVALASGPTPKAQAWTSSETFCENWHGAYGGPNDRCYATYPRPLEIVQGAGRWHSACVDAVNYPSNTLVTSWVCAPTEYWATLWLDKTPERAGVVRNNVYNDQNWLAGIQYW
jgi:hypothetical protein